MDADVSTLSMENVVEPSLFSTAVDVSRSALYLNVWWGRITCTAKNGHCLSRTCSSLGFFYRTGDVPGLRVCDAALKPYENFYRCPETDLRLLWTDTEEERCYRDRGRKACWIEMESSQEPVKGIFLLN